MHYSSTPTTPAIDMIHLAVSEYKLLPGCILMKSTTCNPVSGAETIKRYHNETGLGIEVCRDRQGNNTCYCFIRYNPNKAPGSIEALCKAAGVLVDAAGGRVQRLDIARDRVLSTGVTAYHPVIRAAAGGRVVVHQYASSITVKNGSGQVCLYDKTVESKLSTPGVIRLEVRLFKSANISKHGIRTYADLRDADLLYLYQVGGNKYLPKLLSSTGVDAEIIGRGAMQLRHLYETGNSRPLNTFLCASGLLSIGGVDAVLQVIDAAGLTKQKRYSAKQQVLKYAGAIHVETGYLRDEILSYFTAA
jgi:hypothetical protein